MDTAKLALVFPGQGSQKVGMLAELAQAHPVLLDSFREASDALGYDVWALIQEGPQDSLNLTEKTQPLLLTASVALWRLWCSLGGARPSLLAGHSLGEFSALVCAGTLEFADAVRLVRARGQFMQTAVPVGEGAMAAILGLDDDAIVAICGQVQDAGVVEAVNFNAPGQVVIAGQVAAVEQAIALCKEQGAKRAMPLPVSAPFHTSLMKPAGERLQEAMAGLVLKAPAIPVVHNVHCQTETDPEAIRALLVRQIHSPVQWTGCVRYLV
ncbi:MAG TPA: ACP S-malonyltransferase, partial [Spongiibacteraceae bacterium]|nr:ACP S-malonyltransferase [Spongiibacteraceae bacterium]